MRRRHPISSAQNLLKGKEEGGREASWTNAVLPLDVPGRNMPNIVPPTREYEENEASHTTFGDQDYFKDILSRLQIKYQKSFHFIIINFF